MAGLPSFGKTILTRTLHNILDENSVEESLILLRLSSFWFLLFLSPVLNTKNYAKTCDHGDISSHDSPTFDKRDIGICLSSCDRHVR
jgi:hypothetical protein